MTPAASPTPNSDLTYSETRIGFDSGNSQATLTASGTVGLYDISSGQLNGTYQYNSHETYSYSESGGRSGRRSGSGRLDRRCGRWGRSLWGGG